MAKKTSLHYFKSPTNKHRLRIGRRIYCVTASCVVVKIETNGHESNKIHPPCVMLYRSHRLSQEFVVIA